MKSVSNLALCLTMCLNMIMVAMIILSLSGMLSVFERVTLALVHFSHGPLMYGLHGLFLFVCDGMKLYSKYSMELVFGLGMILFTTLMCSFCFTASNMASDLGILSWHCKEFEMLIGLMILSLGCVGTIIPAMMISSKYVIMGSISAMKIIMLADMLFDTSLFIFLMHSKILSSMNAASISLYVIIFMFNFVWLTNLFLSSGSAPFDLAESESELMAGNMTEVGGVSFSFLLLIDYCEMMVFVSIFSVVTFMALTCMLGLFMYTFWLYLGSMLLCRLYVHDLMKFVYINMCWTMGFTLVIIFDTLKMKRYYFIYFILLMVVYLFTYDMLSHMSTSLLLGMIQLYF